MILWIEIEHFGPINKFSYDLDKDLIITYGHNNIGKSYSMQIVYLLLKTFLGTLFETKNSHIFLYAMSFASSKQSEDLVYDFISSGEEIKDITDIVVQIVYKNLGGILLPEFINSCNNTFGNLEKALDHMSMIKVKHDKFQFEIDLKREEIKGTIDSKEIRLKRGGYDLGRSQDHGTYLEIYVASDIGPAVGAICEEVRKRLKLCVDPIRALFDAVYFLPASRSGIYSGMNAFGSIVAELSKSRGNFKKKIEFPGISEPISDYFIALSNIKLKVNERLAAYYTLIEDDILKGKVIFDESKNAIMYKPQNMDVDFEMTEVSSMVSEIAPIVAFLKYIVSSRSEKKGRSILFIEEPEAHLHPDNQIALIEIFAKLIDSDVKLIMSSHSNYIFNKLNNLVLGGKLDHRSYQPIMLLNERKGSRSKILPIDELGAEDENFIDVSERLYYEREEIIQRLNVEG